MEGATTVTKCKRLESDQDIVGGWSLLSPDPPEVTYSTVLLYYCA